MRKGFLILLALTVTALLAPATQADELSDSLAKAQALYAQGKYTEAIAELNFAIAQIQTKQMEQYETLFPVALPTWTADKIESQAGMAIMGGGISLSRYYHNEAGANVSVSIVSDSPMMSGMLMAMGNPLMLGGKKVVTIKGEKAVDDWDNDSKSGKLQLIVDSRVLITIDGNSLEKKEDLLAYANAIDFAKLRAILKR